MSGSVSGSYSVNNSIQTIAFDPTSNFKSGETVTVTLTTSIQSIGGGTLVNPVTWQFVVEAPQGYSNFIDSGQLLGTLKGREVSLGDIDGDGDLDAFVANRDQGNKVWINDGNGNFTGSGQSLGNSHSSGLCLGDIDNDGDLDALIANYSIQVSKVWLNDGSGIFTDSGQSLGILHSMDIVIGDVDGDGDLDVFVANKNGQANEVWLNDGNGNFTNSGQSLGSSESVGIALGDVDGDGDLDVFTGNYGIGSGRANKVWLNVPDLVAETSLAQGLSSNITDVIVVNVNIKRTKDSFTDKTAPIPGGISSYAATANGTPGSVIECLTVNGVSPFNEPSFNATTGVFSVDNVTSPIQAANTTVAEVVVILTGNTTTSVNLTIFFQDIIAAGNPGLNVPEESAQTLIFLRGDTDGSGMVDIGDASWIAQYVVGMRTLAQINALNAASVSHDGASGDIIDIGDSSWIAQYVVGMRNGYFE